MEHDGGAGNLTPGGAVGTRNLTPDGAGGGAHSLTQDSRNGVHNLTPDGTGSSLTPEQEKIVDDCEDIWGQVQQVHICKQKISMKGHHKKLENEPPW